MPFLLATMCAAMDDPDTLQMPPAQVLQPPKLEHQDAHENTTKVPSHQKAVSEKAKQQQAPIIRGRRWKLEFGSSGLATPISQQNAAAMKTCFDKAATTACLVKQPSLDESIAYSQCYGGARQLDAERVLLASLVPGDRVLTATITGSLYYTRVVSVQHLCRTATADMLTLRTADGSSITATPDHALFVNGVLAAAAEATVGSLLAGARGASVAVTSVVAKRREVVNAVTASGTLLASDVGAPVLASSHPMWIAPLMHESWAVRTIANAALLLVGDVVDASAFVLALVAKICAMLLAGAWISRGFARRGGESRRRKWR